MSKISNVQEGFIEKALDFYRNKNKGYLDLAMRMGKTRIAIEIIKRLVEEKEPILISYRDNKLMLSWKKEIEKWELKHNNISFCNFRSFGKFLDKKFSFFIVDEFHAASENERLNAYQISDNSKYTLLLSGTVSYNTKIEWAGFDEIAKYTTEDGIKDNVLADYRITVHVVDLDDTIPIKDKKGKSYTEKERYKRLSYVIDSKKMQGENTMYLSLARNRLSLSSIGKMNYLKKLLTSMRDKRVIVFTGLSKVADSIGIPSFHSENKKNSNFEKFINGEINHLALAAMGKVGVTYPMLDSVILLNFTYNPEETAQILNRAIKLDYFNKIADLHIICLNESPELKKLRKTLEMMNLKKVKYEN